MGEVEWLRKMEREKEKIVVGESRGFVKLLRHMPVTLMASLATASRRGNAPPTSI